MTNSLLTADWLNHLAGFERLLIGYSGGLDSTVLLHLLISEPALKSKLIPIYVNHGISPNALVWQAHCQDQCERWGLSFIAETVQIDKSNNIEERARKARYEVFRSHLGKNDALLLAHHQDDQAETLLLQLFRGAGIDGLSAMMASMPFAEGIIARPLLAFSREQLADYAKNQRLKWIEDESNQQTHYSRNFLRNDILPLLSNQWPGLVQTIARTAAHMQQAQTNLDALATIDCEDLQSNRLSLTPLKSLSAERINNVLRVWLKKNRVQMPSTLTFHRIIEELINAKTDAAPLISWGNIEIRRYRDDIYIREKNQQIWPESIDWLDFPNPLIINTIKLSTTSLQEGLLIPKDAKISIKFRQGGELFRWHGQNKQLKKLTQEWGIPPWLRDEIPLLYINDQLAAVIGYATSDLFCKS